MRLIHEQWISYVKMVYPPSGDMPSAQKIEVRRAFYAGIAAFFAIASGEYSQSVPEDIFVAMVQSELNEFLDAVHGGRA